MNDDGARRIPGVTPELPGLGWRALLRLLHRLPQAALSRSLGTLADIPLPRSMRRAVLGTFARALGIAVDEAEQPLHEYASLNEFFVRRLRPGVRTWPGDDRILAAPVDGIIGQHGTIRDDRIIQAKGRDYSAAGLLGDAAAAARFEGGAFLTIYLSPRHYHRIHAPCGGAIASARYVPGALLPVNEPAVVHIPDLFPRNERVICSIEDAIGAVAVVAVGAYNVGRISTSFDPEWVGPGCSVTNRREDVPRQRAYEPARAVQQGDEIMAFHLGSTVVVLVSGEVRNDAPPAGAEVRLGSALLRRG